MTHKDQVFIQTVREFHEIHGRHTLPWRKTHNPYRILVSEIMLQQTQVDRVIPKYQAFLKRFPTVSSLARATLGDVLVMWQGLGYNRRAKYLYEAAGAIMTVHKGVWPKSYEGMLTLPGVGPYTAGAVSAFAFNIPVTMIETNIRTVYIHHYFPHTEAVSDSMLMPIIARTLDTNNPRLWYAALMDYGSHLKVTVGNKSRQSRHHTKQTTFKGSDRFIRGSILRHLADAATGLTKQGLCKVIPGIECERVHLQLEKLSSEGLVSKQGSRYTLPT
jgi:A/G-specific adenine glycosylase